MKKSLAFFFVASTLLAPALTLGATAAAAKPAAPIIVPEEEAVIRAFDNAVSSVVSIVISEQLGNLVGGTSKQDSGGGTGFFVSTDGYIITNKHVVVRDDVDYTAVTSDGREYAASVLARDPLFDVAIVKVEGQGFTPARLGDSDKLRIGQTVLAIGNVLAEFRNTVTRGIVSGIGRTISASGPLGQETIEGAIQTDASINPGNSGGPLINLKGEVIGINTATYTSAQGLGFAIPINRATQALSIYRKTGRLARAFLGVRYVMLNRAIARSYNLTYTEGAYVLVKNDNGEPGVLPDSPAATAGILPGDIILSVGNEKPTFTNSLGMLIARKQPNETIRLKLLRSGTEMYLDVTLGERSLDLK
jgi:serine protease Do